jgi:hypothetical protein
MIGPVGFLTIGPTRPEFGAVAVNGAVNGHLSLKT